MHRVPDRNRFKEAQSSKFRWPRRMWFMGCNRRIGDEFLRKRSEHTTNRRVDLRRKLHASRLCQRALGEEVHHLLDFWSHNALHLSIQIVLRRLLFFENRIL